MATIASAKPANSNNNANKKRGAYEFDSATVSPATAKNQAKKTTTTAKKIAAKTTTAARNNLDLGLASIAKSTSSATRQTANTVNDSLDRNSNAVRGAFANATANAKQIQDKITTFSKEVTNNLTQSASRASQNANTGLEISRQHAEAFSQTLQSASEAAKQATTQLFNFANAAFAENVATARQALECRNASDLFQLQSEALRQNFEAAFEQAVRISEIAVQAATEALEPINESIAKTSKKLSALVS
jgi:phasin family protein